MAVSKGLTGGYMPLAATLATDEIYRAFLGTYEEFKTFFHGHSYTGNPLGCAVALANLKIFRAENTLARLRPKIKFMTRSLQPLRELPHVGDIRCQGLMVGIELVRNKATKEPYPPKARIGHRIAAAARTRGLLLRPLGNVIVLLPPLSISRNDMGRMIDILHDVITAQTKKDGEGKTG
jgi:adenosylmethionine-8-amino-7-oxononanoate aminotransferase